MYINKGTKVGATMFKTANVSTLRRNLSTFLDEIEDGPVLVLSHSTPRAVLLDHEVYESLVEKVELLEDIAEGQRALAEYESDPGTAIEAEEVFERLGY